MDNISLEEENTMAIDILRTVDEHEGFHFIVEYLRQNYGNFDRPKAELDIIAKLNKLLRMIPRSPRVECKNLLKQILEGLDK